MNPSWTTVGLVALLAWAAFAFNRLVRDRNRVRAGWSDVDVQLKRRHDLVPQLVEAVKGYAAYEKATLSAVTALRAQAEQAASIARKGEIEGQLGEGVRRLVAVAEAYPDLKASDQFGQLARDLVQVEDHIQYARRYYNGAVRLFNTRVESFPDLLLARPLGFRQAEFFQAEDEARAAPIVELT